MPTRPTKGDHGHGDQGSQGRGNQKAVYGSGVTPEVAEGQEDAIRGDGADSAAGNDLGVPDESGTDVGRHPDDD